MIYRSLKSLVVGFASVSLLGCGGGGGTDTVGTAATAKSVVSDSGALAAPSAMAQSSTSDLQAVAKNLKGYPLSTSIWPGGAVKVCWLLDDVRFSTTLAQRQWVREAVEQTWASVSSASFSGWDKCESEQYDGIKIAIGDQTPVTWGLGTGILTSIFPWNMRLNFSFENFSPSCRDFDNYEKCIRYIAVHNLVMRLDFHMSRIAQTLLKLAKMIRTETGNLTGGTETCT